MTTPLSGALEIDDVVHLRAEDRSGAFGILGGHADFLTTLTVSVISWQTSNGEDHHCTVRGGTLTVSSGTDINVATREMVLSDDLEHLLDVVLEELRAKTTHEEAARSVESQLQAAAIDQIYRYLRPEESGERGAAQPVIKATS